MSRKNVMRHCAAHDREVSGPDRMPHSPAALMMMNTSVEPDEASLTPRSSQGMFLLARVGANRKKFDQCIPPRSLATLNEAVPHLCCGFRYLRKHRRPPWSIPPCCKPKHNITIGILREVGLLTQVRHVAADLEATQELRKEQLALQLGQALAWARARACAKEETLERSGLGDERLAASRDPTARPEGIQVCAQRLGLRTDIRLQAIQQGEMRAAG
mmetsp:Transcript_44422/g.117886  ORF Transcript_44422/g.117886 Transcript_44422/m.117886 type:complete len:216 (-) Transcript_44422:1374-2021(-)